MTSQPIPPDDRPVTREVDLGTARLLPDLDRPGGWLLTMDGTPQSYVDLNDPRYLEFEYVQRLAHVVDLCTDERTPLDVLHLGGGALTLPRYLAAARPGSRQQVAELDAALIELVRERLPWAGGDAAGKAGPGSVARAGVPAGNGAEAGPGRAGITVHAADARAFLAAQPPASVDLVIADVFGGHTIPASLTTVEFTGLVARVLREDGVYAANLADGAPLAFLRGQIATVGAVLPELALVAEPSVLRGRRYGNVVLVASRRPLPVAGLTRRAAGDPFPARVVAGAEVAALASRARPVTDETAVPSPPPPTGAFSV